MTHQNSDAYLLPYRAFIMSKLVIFRDDLYAASRKTISDFLNAKDYTFFHSNLSIWTLFAFSLEKRGWHNKKTCFWSSDSSEIKTPLRKCCCRNLIFIDNFSHFLSSQYIDVFCSSTCPWTLRIDVKITVCIDAINLKFFYYRRTHMHCWTNYSSLDRVLISS